MSGEVLVDALPYIDLGYDEPGVKQAALALVEEECRRYKPGKNYLDFLGPMNLHVFETELLKNEFERMEQRQPMEMISFKRYELPPPPANKQTDATAWFECVENSCAQLEHQASRLLNLEIMSEYGSSSWRVYNQTLKIMFDQAEKQLESLKKEIQNTNVSRKTEQAYAGSTLRSLESNWVGLVSKNYEIECAIVELEKELLEAKKKSVIENINVMNIGAAETTEEQTLNDLGKVDESNESEKKENPESGSENDSEINNKEMETTNDVNMEENNNECGE